MDNKKKATTKSLINVLKRKNKVEEARASSSKVKTKQENTNLRAQKLMRAKWNHL